MTTTTRRVRTVLAAAAVTLATAGAGLLVSVSPAQARSDCAEDRATARELAAAGDFTEPATVEMTGGVLITLRNSAGPGCAWGLLTGLGWGASIGMSSGDVWLDLSRDGGATWDQGPVQSNGRNQSTYTATHSTAGYNAIRVCGQTMINAAFQRNWQGAPQVNEIFCSAWISPQA